MHGDEGLQKSFGFGERAWVGGIDKKVGLRRVSTLDLSARLRLRWTCTTIFLGVSHQQNQGQSRGCLLFKRFEVLQDIYALVERKYHVGVHHGWVGRVVNFVRR